MYLVIFSTPGGAEAAAGSGGGGGAAAGRGDPQARGQGGPRYGPGRGNFLTENSKRTYT